MNGSLEFPDGDCLLAGVRGTGGNDPLAPVVGGGAVPVPELPFRMDVGARRGRGMVGIRRAFPVVGDERSRWGRGAVAFRAAGRRVHDRLKPGNERRSQMPSRLRRRRLGVGVPGGGTGLRFRGGRADWPTGGAFLQQEPVGRGRVAGAGGGVDVSRLVGGAGSGVGVGAAVVARGVDRRRDCLRGLALAALAGGGDGLGGVVRGDGRRLLFDAADGRRNPVGAGEPLAGHDRRAPGIRPRHRILLGRLPGFSIECPRRRFRLCPGADDGAQRPVDGGLEYRDRGAAAGCGGGNLAVEPGR